MHRAQVRTASGTSSVTTEFEKTAVRVSGAGIGVNLFMSAFKLA